jgi:Concanavalin A-like lectin/glucanases superfamily/PEP-CTERM motif
MKPLLLPLRAALACWMISPASAAMISYYALEEGTGTTTAQSTGGGAPNGTLVGVNTTWVPGIAPGSGDALSFGTGSRVEIAGNSIWHGLSGFSVSTWIKPSQHAGNGHAASPIFWLGTSAGSARFTIQLNDQGDLRVGGRRTGSEPNFNTTLIVGTNITGNNDTVAADPIQIGGLYHVAATADYATGLLSLYLDGVLVASNTMAAWGTGVSASDQQFIMRIGSNHNGSEQFQGVIDDVQIFNTALTSTEVAVLAVPEPASVLLGGLGIISLFSRRRRVG